ncbi:tectonin beta-propeller repeat-containing protein 2 isoform X2 [Bacillus rossius redtenbacheri]|uniref:tectonin beta-propeller repeat-containing protein 2 isoform X2 n=1 Tax=Bacillus rossius redtenbacheri TaxID=93214 RepID=UPI002FDD5EF8
MANAGGGEGLLREWAPLTNFLQQVPLRAQRGLFTYELNLTCVDCLPEFLVVGTNLGLVYWYNRTTCDLQRLRCENTSAVVTCVKVISTVDYMVAAGNEQGVVTVFQVPKTPPDSLPDSMKLKKNKQVERYTISGLHTTAVTAIEWSMNGMKLFSGDRNGIVVLTEFDFYMHLSKSMEILNEKYEIVQLSYSQQLLLVSTVYRSIVCHRDDRWRVQQVGQKERKTLGHFGATFSVGEGRPQDLVIYASRPGLRLWLANRNGVVQQTLIYKDALMNPHPSAPLMNPARPHVRLSRGDQQLGRLLVFQAGLLVTHSADTVYVLDPAAVAVVAAVTDLRSVRALAVSRDEVFVLEGSRSLVRVAYAPEVGALASPARGLNADYQDDAIFLSMPASLSDKVVTSSLVDLTSKIKDTSHPFHGIGTKISMFGKLVYDEPNEDGTDEDAVIADEVLELPPIIPLSVVDLAELTVEKLPSPAIDCLAITDDCSKESKEVLHAEHLRGNDRKDVLQKIGEQQFEDILYKPRKKKRRRRPLRLATGAESGSDTVSTNSVRSAVSEGEEDPWTCEQLDASADWSNTSTHAGSTRSSSEETLVKTAGDCEEETAQASTVVGEDSESQATSDGSKPTVLHLPQFGSRLLPDLRSPTSIEKEVAEREKILARVLDLDILCPKNVNGHVSPVSSEAVAKGQPLIPTFAEELSNALKLDESTSAVKVEDTTPSEHSCKLFEDKFFPISLTTNNRPPSCSSEPSSICAWMEQESVVSVECDNAMFSSNKKDRWLQHKVPGYISHLSVCGKYVCCVDSKDVVYYSSLDGLGLRWHRLDYQAKQVAVSQSSRIVWKLYRCVAYALLNPQEKGPFGDEWKEVRSGVHSIAVDEPVAWIVSTEGSVFTHKLLNIDDCSGSFVQIKCPSTILQVCCFNGDVLALTTSGELLYRVGVIAITPEGKHWNKVTATCDLPTITSIALGSHNAAWVVDTKNNIFFSTDYKETASHWWQQFRSRMAESLRQQSGSLLATSSDTVWIADKLASAVHVNKTSVTGHMWNHIRLRGLLPSVRWQQLTAEGVFEDKGQLWLLSQSGDLFCSHPRSDTFHVLPLPCHNPVVCVAASAMTVWLLDSEGRIYVRQGISDTCLDGTTWKELSLAQLGDVHLKHISCGCDVVWACDDQGTVYMTMGSPHEMAVSSTFSPVWITVDDRSQRKYFFTKVFVGTQTSMVWAIDNKRNVYVREAIFHDFQLGIGWVLVLGIEAVDLSISASAVWALSPAGGVYCRCGISQNNFIGDYWKKIPGSLTAITVSMNDSLWGLDKHHGLLKHQQSTIRLMSPGTEPIIGDAHPAADDDWEVVL